jgi:seryl-tRNA synthetase
MLDRKLFREDPDAIRRNLEKRGQADRVAEVDRFVALDERVRALGARSDELRHAVKEASAGIGRALKAGEDATAAKERVKQLNDEAATLERERAQIEAERDALELVVPNMLHPDVPFGRSEADNPVLRTWGAPPVMDFAPVAHDDLGERLGILDFQRGSKISGARFTPPPPRPPPRGSSTPSSASCASCTRRRATSRCCRLCS